MEQIESYQQCCVYEDSHIDVCFEIKKGVMNIQKNTKEAAHKTLVVRQIEKKTYTHETDS